MEKLRSILLFFHHKAGEAPTAISHLLQEKLPWLIHVWEEIAGFLVDKSKDVLPPGSSSKAIRVWGQSAMAVVGRVLMHYLLSAASGAALSACARGFLRMGTMCCGGTGRMMKAPGRAGKVMARALFEANPRGYFRALHANRPLASPTSALQPSWLDFGGKLAAMVVLELCLLV